MREVSQPDPEAVQQVAGWLAGARRVLFITGAGLSADSGLPTYRGVGGLYNDAETEEGYAIEDALSGWMFAKRPELVWRHILTIEEACRGKTFNAGHAAIAALEAQADKEVTVLTQNVDGFHRKAGSENVIDIHGDVHALYCAARCGWSERVQDYRHLGDALPPRCPACGEVIRPDVVLFGEMLPEAKLARLQAELEAGPELIFSVGTSSLFPYIAQPVLLAKRLGARAVEINPGRTQVSGAVDLRMRSGAAATLEAIVAALPG